MSDKDPIIERINTLTQTSRTTWFGLLSYLAFVGVTLLGVEDADFFIDSRQTDLPLIGVSIPTASFFVFAPILGAALYIYLHLHLRKLWEVLNKANARPGDKRLEEQVLPWLVSDLVLRMRKDDAIKARPMDWLAGLVTRLLVWVAGPFVLLAFWWRSMPAHDEWLTLLIGGTAILSLYAGFSSWWRLQDCRKLEESQPTLWRGWYRRPLAAITIISLIAVSWLRTEGGIDFYVNRAIDIYENLVRNGAPLERFTGKKFNNGDEKPPLYVQEEFVANLPWVWTLDNVTFPTLADLEERGVVVIDWTPSTPSCLEPNDPAYPPKARNRIVAWVVCKRTGLAGRSTLARTDLAGVEIVPDTAGIPARDIAQRRFRAQWCRRQGLPLNVCGNVYTVANRAPDHVLFQRTQWCLDNDYPRAPLKTVGTPGLSPNKPDPELSSEGRGKCGGFFAGQDEDFEEEWAAERANTLAQLERRDLRGRDLRGAELFRAILTDADLTAARLEGADLFRARMEGADLTAAQMEGADLYGARLEGADLRDARLEGADLGEARMEGADLFRARMEGADLRRARLEGADLRDARLERADLRWARLEGANFGRARLEGADLHDARLEGADLTAAQMEGANLREARLEGADLTAAQMEGAILYGAHIDETTNFDAAVVKFAALKSSDLSKSNLTQDQVNAIYADGSVQQEHLPKGVTRPGHWPDEPLDDGSSFFGLDEDSDFAKAWRAWQQEQGYDP